jgi:hypothetical protein
MEGGTQTTFSPLPLLQGRGMRGEVKGLYYLAGSLIPDLS